MKKKKIYITIMLLICVYMSCSIYFTYNRAKGLLKDVYENELRVKSGMISSVVSNSFIRPIAVNKATKAYFTYDGISRFMNPETDERDLWYKVFMERDTNKQYLLDVDTDAVRIERDYIEIDNLELYADGECYYEIGENGSQTITYLDDLGWYLVVKNNSSFANNVYNLLIPSLICMILYLLLVGGVLYFGGRNYQNITYIQ